MELLSHTTAWSGQGGSPPGSVARGHNFTLANGSCFDLVKMLPDASVDLICIDPPYTQGSSPPVDPKVCSYQNVAWSEAQWRAILREGTRVLRKGGKQLIFCSNTLRRELEALVDSDLQKTCKMDCPYVWERTGNLLTTADRVSYAYREPALEFVLVVQQRHEVAASSLASSAQGASRILGRFGRPEGASVKHPDLYRELLGRYQPGVVLDYCMNTGVCGLVALELGHRFLGVELVPAIYSEALANLAQPWRTQQIYEDYEAAEIFTYLDGLEVEYHKPYERFGKQMHVPRGQASYALGPETHYDYPAAGGSPPNYLMYLKLKEITAKVNSVLGTNFNTILLNKYVTGCDNIGFHSDNETGWVTGSGFATLAFGATRDFALKPKEAGPTKLIPHAAGHVIYLPHPMNQHWEHSVPVRSGLQQCRISLTFRQIEPLGEPSSAPVPPPSKPLYPPKASAPKAGKRKAKAICTICTINTVDTRPCLGGGSRCRRCGMYWMRHKGEEEWHEGVKPGPSKSAHPE
jgi:alkylated DNA repair dioxygenase AlkB